MTEKKILVIGGDLRIIYLIDSFLKNGFDLNVFGMDYNTQGLGIIPKSNLGQALDESDIIILPLPYSRDKKTISAPFFKAEITISSFFDGLTEKHTVFGGMLDDAFKAELEKRNVKYFDFFTDEVLTLKNAAITAEGAIALAIDNTDFSLTDSRSLILGYGRIAKFLAKYLTALGSQVTIAARRKSALAEAKLNGYGVCSIDSAEDYLNKSDIIFNTVPAMVLDRQRLECIRKSTLVVDLASKPGGVDLSSASALGINHIQALSVPGKIAPESAGCAIYKTICEMLK